MMKPALVLVLGLAGAIAGCSTDQIARAIYYSLRVDNQAVNNTITPPLQSRGDPMSFDQYQRERRSETSR
jgi:uncharacterized lipoprotein YmbA